MTNGTMIDMVSRLITANMALHAALDTLAKDADVKDETADHSVDSTIATTLGNAAETIEQTLKGLRQMLGLRGFHY